MKLSDLRAWGIWRRIGHVVGALLLLAVVGSVVITAAPAVVGAEESFVVRSDSMSPAIDAGSVVFVTSVPANTLGVGDIITFQRHESGERITHRIIAVVERGGKTQFRTKGDANEEADQGLVAPDQIVGKVVFSLPLVGWLLAFAGSRAGILLLLIVPAILLVVTELWSLHLARKPSNDGGET